MWGLKGFIGIGGYKKGYLVKIDDSFIAKMYLKGGSKKDFGRYVPISSEIRGILYYPTNEGTISQFHRVNDYN